jgi:hypothetical protein
MCGAATITSGRRDRIRIFLVGIALVFGCSSNDDEVTASRCTQLRDHLIDLRLNDAVAGKQMPTITSGPPIRVPVARGRTDSKEVPAPQVINMPIDITAHRAAMKQALGDQFVDTCQHKMTAPQLKCLLAAETSSAASSCSSPPPSAQPAATTASK